MEPLPRLRTASRTAGTIVAAPARMHRGESSPHDRRQTGRAMKKENVQRFRHPQGLVLWRATLNFQRRMLHEVER